MAPTIRHLRWAWTIAATLALTGCAARETSSRAPLTERQRDSVIARSSLPGAGTVGRALEQSDAASRRVARLDSLTR
ncbi:MAG: hypothetical protein E6K80_01555 [Candidatus Eisenbacteria bacterium]|uniref:Uncharacterized protein n=1 Tax=Eiseniibacteriota bacterium TaxID=2212470 RepID=A0A538UAD1_UNCEI|nr:MAG: hypothetical protein E6K80_01555 [Candidatus Eisenbacteria bacterium]